MRQLGYLEEYLHRDTSRYMSTAIEARVHRQALGSDASMAKRNLGAWPQALAPENLGKMLLPKIEKNCYQFIKNLSCRIL